MARMMQKFDVPLACTGIHILRNFLSLYTMICTQCSGMHIFINADIKASEKNYFTVDQHNFNQRYHKTAYTTPDVIP